VAFQVINYLLYQDTFVEGDFKPEIIDSQGHGEESNGESSGYHYGSVSENQGDTTDEFINPFATANNHNGGGDSNVDDFNHNGSGDGTTDDSGTENDTTDDSGTENDTTDDSTPEYGGINDLYNWESSYVPDPKNDDYVNSFGTDEENVASYNLGDDSDGSEFYESLLGDSYDDWGSDSTDWMSEDWFYDDWFGDDWGDSWDTASFFGDDWLNEGGYSDDWLDAGGFADEENFFGDDHPAGGGWFSNLDPNSPLSLALDDENSSLSLALDDPNSMIAQAMNDPNSLFRRGVEDPNSELSLLLNDPNALSKVDFTDPDSFIAKFFGS
jgi:hypothetical protein